MLRRPSRVCVQLSATVIVFGGMAYMGVFALEPDPSLMRPETKYRLERALFLARVVSAPVDVDRESRRVAFGINVEGRILVTSIDAISVGTSATLSLFSGDGVQVERDYAKVRELPNHDVWVPVPQENRPQTCWIDVPNSRLEFQDRPECGWEGGLFVLACDSGATSDQDKCVPRILTFNVSGITRDSRYLIADRPFPDSFRGFPAIIDSPPAEWTLTGNILTQNGTGGFALFERIVVESEDAANLQ